MKLSRNSLKQIVQEELAGLLEVDRPAVLAAEGVLAQARANIKTAQAGMGIASDITDAAAAKVKDIEIPEVGDATGYTGPLINNPTGGDDDTADRLKNAIKNTTAVATESAMKLSRNDLKALIQEEMGVLLEQPPAGGIDTSGVQQSSKVTQILRLIDGLREDEINALLTAMKSAGMPIAM